MATIAVMLAEGFEEIEGLTVVDICRRCGIEVVTVSITDDRNVMGSHKIPVIADEVFANVDFDKVDMIVLPGGLRGTQNLEACEPLMKKIDEFYKSDKYIAAICAAPSIFGHRDILNGRVACSYPSFEGHLAGAVVSRNPVEKSDNVITGRGMGVSIEFALKIAEQFVDAEKVEDVAVGIIYR
ncbi:MAG: DJ-1/PfpI family protein [Lachnospiraceae bacterium]|nr:DJ-1/PfpI family protein [Lachnospiraceae bacterium]